MRSRSLATLATNASPLFAAAMPRENDEMETVRVDSLEGRETTCTVTLPAPPDTQDVAGLVQAS